MKQGQSHIRHILKCETMNAVDQWAIKQGVAGASLMQAAGQSVFNAIINRWASRRVQVLCGSGNNGGDGFVVARCLEDAGWPVELYTLGSIESLSGDAAWAASLWDRPVSSLDEFQFKDGALIVDALLGAGLSRPLEDRLAELAQRSMRHKGPIISIDVPTGLSGDAWPQSDPVFKSDLCVTFHRLKPAHVLYPSRDQCGEIHLADIGIPDGWSQAVSVVAMHNDPSLWPYIPINPTSSTHKHSRGRVSVLSGPHGSTAASRMTSLAALYVGTGFVTLHCPEDALSEASKQSLAVMTKAISYNALLEDLRASRPDAIAYGMGAGLNETTRQIVLDILSISIPTVLDADALSVFKDDPEDLFNALHDQVVLTPHEGEFARLFPELTPPQSNKIDRVKKAAERAGCVVLLKGPDTVIVTPEGECVVNTHASPRLATAGSGDVLAGVIAGLMGQGHSPMKASLIGAWLHGDAGLKMLPGQTAEELINFLPDSLQSIQNRQRQQAALKRLHKQQTILS